MHTVPGISPLDQIAAHNASVYCYALSALAILFTLYGFVSNLASSKSRSRYANVDIFALGVLWIVIAAIAGIYTLATILACVR